MSRIDLYELNVKDLSFINNLKSIAVIGPSKKREYFFLKNHAEYFQGPLYAVHPTVEEIPNFDKKNIFPSLQEIPGEVDFAFIACEGLHGKIRIRSIPGSGTTVTIALPIMSQN